MLFENAARLLLVAHAVLGAAVVALTTHHLVWIIRSRGARTRGEPRFALLASGALLGAFSLGCAIYPTYRVRVRAEYFDAREAHDEARAVTAKHRVAAAPPSMVSLERAARIFDMKEHLVALVFMASVALLWLSRRVDPSELSGRTQYLALGWCVCLASWFALVVGLYTASLRSIGVA
jgi:hypothetical protein